MNLRNSSHFALVTATGLIAVRLAFEVTTPVSVTIGSSANPSVFGRPVVLTATVSPPAASGNVTFYDGTPQIAQAGQGAHLAARLFMIEAGEDRRSRVSRGRLVEATCECGGAVSRLTSLDETPAG